MTDKERKEQILVMSKTYIKEIKAFRKIQKKKLKDLEKVNQDRNSTKEDFERIFDEGFYDRV